MATRRRGRVGQRRRAAPTTQPPLGGIHPNPYVRRTPRGGAERVIAIDRFPYRLEMARKQGAEVVNYEQVDSVIETLNDMTGTSRPRRVHRCGRNGSARPWCEDNCEKIALKA